MSSNDSFFSRWSSKPGIWFSIVSIIALLWNIGGAIQFINSLTASSGGTQGSMMTPEQLKVISSTPIWVSIVFGIGVVTSLIGSVFLYLRHRLSSLTLIVSFVAFLILSLAYVIYGVFTAVGMQQVIVMSVVVIGALALVFLSRLIPSQSDPS